MKQLRLFGLVFSPNKWGEVGPSGPLEDALREAGIGVVIRP